MATEAYRSRLALHLGQGWPLKDAQREARVYAAYVARGRRRRRRSAPSPRRKSSVRRNPSSSTAAVQRRAQRLHQAISRRSRARVGSSAKLGALHGAANRVGSVLHRRYRAEDAAPAGRLRSMQREAALARALARARRRKGALAVGRAARLEVAHRRALARLHRQGWPTMAEVSRRHDAKRKRRRANPMAKRKRTAAQRRAFRKMLAGLKRHKARKNPGRKRRRGRARRRKTTVTVTTNPRRRRRKNSRGGSHMAKRRHRRRNPGRRHHRRRHHNPHHRRHRRRNPAMGGILRSTISAAVPSAAAGAVVALADAKFFGDKSMGVNVLGKLAIAAGLGYALRNRPRTSALVMGSIFGTLAYQIVAKAQGGIVAADKTDATKKMAALVYADRRMAALVERSGALRTQPTLSGMGQSMGDGGTALPTMPIYDPVNLG